MSDDMKPAPAQVAYTTNYLSSPQIIGVIVAMVMFGAQKAGLHIFDSAEAQGMLNLAVGWGVGALANWLFPSASGRLGLSAPMAWNAPAPQDVPVGSSLVSVMPAVAGFPETGRETTVRPANDLGQMVRVAEVAAAVASAAHGEPVTVTVTPAGHDNEAVRVSPAEAAAAPPVPASVIPSPAPRVA